MLADRRVTQKIPFTYIATMLRRSGEGYFFP